MVKQTQAQQKATPAAAPAEEAKATTVVVPKKKFTVAANGKKVPAGNTIAKTAAPAKKVEPKAVTPKSAPKTTT